MDPNVTGKRMGENNTQHISWLWPADDESVLLIVACSFNTTISSIVSAVFTKCPHPGTKHLRALA